MKNLLRALRFAWPYRFRLLFSFGCALVVALLWGGNFTAIYPILKLLGPDNKNVQMWMDDQITVLEAKLDELNERIEEKQKEKENIEKTRPPGKHRDRELAARDGALSNDQSRMSDVSWKLQIYRSCRPYVHRWLPHDRFETLVWILVWVIIAVAIKGIFEFWQESLVGSVVHLSLLDMRNRFFRNVVHMDVNQFSDEGTHELMARFTNDMESLGAGTKTLFGKMVAEPLKAISCVVFACFISWQLTLLFLVLVPIALVFMSKVGRYMKRASRRVLESMSSLYKILQETFQGIKVVKAFTMERYERRRFFVGTKDYYRKGMRVINLEAISGPIMELLGVLAIVLALLVGAYLVLKNETGFWGLNFTDTKLEPESLLQLYALLAAIADPVRKLSNVYTRIQSAAAASDRIFAFMDREPKVRSNPGAARLERHRRSIEFRDVCFSYTPDQPILTNIHLHVRAGETIALVGKNGCGKTTLVGLIARFYDPDHGSILIDGVDLRKVHLRSVRQQIGLVTQETILFDDTIYNNIAYGHRHARAEEVEAAAKRAYAHDFIVKFKQGYDTRVGEMGTSLSGGQRQRIALARAILRNPTILILDEATSAADLESEGLIHKALDEFTENRTTFVITHRMSTLEIADRIIVMENGRIEAIGTHDELLRVSRTYQRLYEMHLQRKVA